MAAQGPRRPGIDVLNAMWAAMHGIAALATGVPIFDPDRARAAAEAAIVMLQGALER